MRLISDDIWQSVERLLPARPSPSRGRTGRPRTSDRDVLEGIACVLSSGIGWARLPTELGYGSGWTCWRRMREWKEAGVFDDVYGLVFEHVGHERLNRWARARLSSVGEARSQLRVRPERERRSD